jgi:hypothetical protein
MGANLIIVSGTGATMREAYADAVEIAAYEYGNDPYNGTITTTSGCIDVTKEFRESGLELDEYADDICNKNKLSKWGNAHGICVSEPVVNTNKIKSQVETTPQRGARAWKTVYVVQDNAGNVLESRAFHIDAINIAREYTERTKNSSQVVIQKVLANSSPLVSKITYKKSYKEKKGLYYFIALAAE